MEIQLQLLMLICCGAAVSDRVTDLGSDVTINCDLDENDVFWIFLKTPDPPTVILRSFSTTTSPHYLNSTFRKKYSVQFKHRLVINNVTADELGVYFCVDVGKKLKFSNSTRLEQTPQTESHNQAVKFIKHNQTELEFIERNHTQWPVIIIISGLLNGLLISVLIVVVFAVGQTKRLEKHIQGVDLQTRVLYQPYDAKLLQEQ